MKSIYKALMVCAVFLIVLLPRLAALDRYVTPDETKWLMRSANFYKALSEADWKNTLQHGHPGVTITWAGAAGIFRRYPQYIGIRPGQIERTEKLAIFLRNQNISALNLLVAGRIFVILAIAAALALAFWVTMELLGVRIALIGISFIAFDPMFFALSRFLHVDAMMSVMMLLSVLAYLGYLYRDPKWYYLALSGAAAGLAWLTKSPSYFLVPFMGLLALIDLLQARKHSAAVKGGSTSWVKLIWKAGAPLAIWGLIAAAVFVLFLPAMWVAPLDTLKVILSQASTYALEGHENVTFFNGQVYPVGESAWFFYPISFVWRSTPIVVIGIGLALIAMIWRKQLNLSNQQVGVIGSLVLFGVLFMVGMSLGEKKFDRYLLPTHLAFDLVAAFGWVILIQALAGRFARSWNTNLRRLSEWAVFAVLIGGQIYGVVSTYPYYFNYFNPLLGGTRKAEAVMMVGWGEGLDQAARFLNTVPESENARVISFYGDGPLSYFFLGDTVGMDVDTKLSYLRKADYVVFYINQWQRKLPSQKVLNYFEKLTPVYVARIGGLDFARVYEMHNAPAP